MNHLNIHESWSKILYPILASETANKLLENLGDNFHPDKSKIFKAFSLPKHKVELVIVGQDVYPNPKLATGIAFGVPEGEDSASLRTIRKELYRQFSQDITHDLFLCTETFIDMSFDNTMQHWVNQGILMLNSALTCNTKPGDQWDIWQDFMNMLFVELDLSLKAPFVFLGKKAQTLSKNIKHNSVLNFPHPAADAYGKPQFVGSCIFESIDKLTKNSIKWVS